MLIFLDAVTIISFAISLLFISMYAIRAPWHKTPFGRALMLHVTSLTYLMTPLLLHHPFNVSTVGHVWVTWMQTSALAFVSFTASYLLYVLIQAPKLVKQKEHD